MVHAERVHGIHPDHLVLPLHERLSLTASPSRALAAQRRCSHGNYQSETAKRGSTVATAMVQLLQLLLFDATLQLSARDR